ncbi:MAG: hypothetical protein V2J62_01645 [candidate division KSB1 bacterium]|nr:hypothetical protein [candidate division KSB1 bacterium]
MRKNHYAFALFFSLSLCIQCRQTTQNKDHTLLITSDFNSVRRCSTLEELHRVAKIMISARPDILAMDVASPDLVNYKSEIGFLVPGSNFDALMSRGYDPYGIVVDTLRNHGITVMANVRMNDHHGRLIYWTQWEREHVHWSLAEDSGARDWKSIGALRHMDYAIEGVREYRFSILREIVNRFNVDGLQLDFGRTAPFVSDPKRENGVLMTTYLRDIRKLLDETARERGLKKMLLGVIVPWDFEFCLAEGLAITKWVAEGLVDYIAPGEWYYADWNIPLKKWRDVTSGTACKLYPFTPGNVSPYQVFEYGERSLLGDNHVLDGPMIRAIADNFMFQEPDGFAFYNFYTFDYEEYYPELRTWTDPEHTASMSKHYFNCRRLMYHANELETFDIGVAFKRHALKHSGDSVDIPFRFSSDMLNSTATLRCVFKNAGESDDLMVRMNDALLSPERQWNEVVLPDSGSVFDAIFWETQITMPPLRSGENSMQITLHNRLGEESKPVEVGEFEIWIEPLN